MTVTNQQNSPADDKTIVKNYFNSTGFDRWQRIYGAGKVNPVQADIRAGHQRTVDTVISWLRSDRNLSNMKICDAGCGVGSLSIPLAQSGARVYASDISEKMAKEAQLRAELELGHSHNPKFSVQELEKLGGRYDTAICIDVLIHYPDHDLPGMIGHLCSLAESRLILSFAPKTPLFSVLKKVGSFFPGASKATRAYLHAASDVAACLQKNGWAIDRQTFIKTRFYFSQILSARPVAPNPGGLN
jgi:magnesium-protoporphyrin O-methyltransferase